MHSKCTFLWCLNPNGISVLKIGSNAYKTVLSFGKNIFKNDYVVVTSRDLKGYPRIVKNREDVISVADI